ncbi:rhodanese-like domain-containing protein [Legionella londiniensis]|uniref:Rhodanese domain protein n=1 Tax=Legionella londiniensis TaxID=45068 RepID=A0A0W0VTH0_9GAMM|nr:rhodanese-like domain-containing protein [Legionella londiniensis]KTD22966.1 Rhodanese domain protein [Legionella londiniensis]STX92926.1 Rhodanese domain protein [Legionella londiniensis]
MNESPINTINVHELKKRCETDPDLCLIDVREIDEWQEVHIPGALHIPKDQLAEKIKSLIPRDKAVYLHCRGGVRSLFAAQCLIEMGYQEVYSIDGGIAEWEICGYPVEKNQD